MTTTAYRPYTEEQILANRTVLSAALRSGDYEQTGGCLFRAASEVSTSYPEGMCCLGVASEEAMLAGVIETYDTDDVLPDRHVQAWLGLVDGSGATGVLDEAGHFMSLTELNDYWLTFEDIADLFDEGSVNLVVHGG